MAIQVKTIKPNTDRQVYTQKMWIKTNLDQKIKPDELFLVFVVFFIGVLVSVLMYLNHEKAVEINRVKAIKQRIEEVKR